MSSNKTNKSFTKRLKIRKSGKIESRTPGHGHFNGKEGGRQQMSKNRPGKVNLSQKVMQRNLPHE